MRIPNTKYILTFDKDTTKFKLYERVRTYDNPRLITTSESLYIIILELAAFDRPASQLLERIFEESYDE